MRSDRSRSATRIALDFSRTTCQIDLRLLGRSVLKGDWETRVNVDGRAAELAGDWTSICWSDDEDGQFLELSLSPPSGARIDRQLFLSRSRRILMMSDIVRFEGASRMELEWRFPASPLSGLAGALPTRAQRLEGLPLDARLIPLSLPADPLAPAHGGTTFQDGKVCVSHAADRSTIVLATAMEWDKDALPKSRIWRSLTITNDGKLVGPAEATAWRVPHAKSQLVYFRSTQGVRRLAFLGYQTFNDCVIGELDDKGRLKEWIMIDSDPGKPLPY